MDRVFSGIQPSGILTLGNYLGALRNFVELQRKSKCYFCVVDLHALTVPQDPDALKSQIKDVAALFLAAGIDPEIATVFIQSHVPAHAELTWLLQCNSYLGELSRMTQFKDKSQKQKSITVGLLTYPTLMASDILLYDANIVPVGADQKQHLELTRDIAIRFNNKYGDIFVVPDVYIPEVGARIMSLENPEVKMSKSDDSPNSYISLLDDEKTIRKKLGRAVTDSESKIKFDIENKPGVSNLLSILSACSNISIKGLEKDFAGQGYGHLKTAVSDAVVSKLAAIQERYQEIRYSDYLENSLKKGAEEASLYSNTVLLKVQKALGIR